MQVEAMIEALSNSHKDISISQVIRYSAGYMVLFDVAANWSSVEGKREYRVSYFDARGNLTCNMICA